MKSGLGKETDGPGDSKANSQKIPQVPLRGERENRGAFVPRYRVFPVSVPHYLISKCWLSAYQLGLSEGDQVQCVSQHGVADRVLPGGELGFLGAHL